MLFDRSAGGFVWCNHGSAAEPATTCTWLVQLELECRAVRLFAYIKSATHARTILMPVGTPCARCSTPPHCHNTLVASYRQVAGPARMTKNAIGLLDLSAGELPLTHGMPAWCIVAQPESYAWRIQHCRPPPYPFVHQVCRGWPLATWHVLLQHGMGLPVLDLRGQSRGRVCAARATRLRRSARLHTGLRSSPSHLYSIRLGPARAPV